MPARAKGSMRACSGSTAIAASIWRVGDAAWNYRRLDAIADLTALPFRDGCFAACLNIVTLEHVREPGMRCCAEMARTLAPGGVLLLIAPHEWEVHQAPHDYFRYTRHGLEYLLGAAGMTEIEIDPVGGYFRLLSRRLLNGLQFFTGGWRWIVFLPAAILLASSGAAAAAFWMDWIASAISHWDIYASHENPDHAVAWRLHGTRRRPNLAERRRWNSRARPWRSDRARLARPRFASCRHTSWRS